MHTLLQLIPSKAAVFFISDENLGWLPITLLLIISFSFDLDYDCSVRHTHLFISFAWWDGLFGDCTDCCTWIMASEERILVRTWLLHFLCMSLSLATPYCVKPKLLYGPIMFTFFFLFRDAFASTSLSLSFKPQICSSILPIIMLYLQPTFPLILYSWHEISTINIKRASPCAGRELNI